MEQSNIQKSEIVIGKATYERYVIKTDRIVIGDSLDRIIEKYVKPVSQENDILYMSKKVMSICSESFLPKEKIKISPLARKLCEKIQLMPDANLMTNMYAMQVAIYMIGYFKVLPALSGCNSRDDFIRKIGDHVSWISGLDGTYFPEYADIAILPPVGGSEICHSIRKDFNIGCITATHCNSKTEIICNSRNLGITLKTIEQVIDDDPLGKGAACTPFCLIRPPQSEIQR